jgi:hypothetical protein
VSILENGGKGTRSQDARQFIDVGLLADVHVPGQEPPLRVRLAAHLFPHPAVWINPARYLGVPTIGALLARISH